MGGRFANIVLASDFLATSLQEQRSNLRWIKDLFHPPIFRSGNQGDSVATLNWDRGFTFNRAEFFARSDMDVSEVHKQVYFDAGDVSEESLQYVRDRFSGFDIVVGYELSEGTRAVLNKCDITYIDVWLHPVRFLADLLFAFRSNDDEINNVLGAYEYPEEKCFIEASLLRIQNYRGYKRFKNDLRPNSALFVGQTLQDKAVASPEGMLTVLNFKDKFREICRTYSHVYYSRHPHVRVGDEACLEFARGTGNVSLATAPTYNLLAAEEIEFVFTVSSSVATEAKFFEKQCLYFHKPPVPVFCGNDGYTSVLHCYLFSDFWRSLFERNASLAKTASGLKLDGPKDRIRDTLSWYWGYRETDKLEAVRANVGKLFTAQKGQK